MSDEESRFCHSRGSVATEETRISVFSLSSCAPFPTEGKHLFQSLVFVTLNLFQSLICFVFGVHYDKETKNKTLNKGISG